VSKVTISEAPLIGLFGSKAAYQVLMYLENYGQGYAAEIARTFRMSLSQVQNQLRKFEELGILVSRREGSARFYYFNRNPVADGLREFLRSLLDSLPDATLQRYYRERQRPRRYGKR
jgi:DNA-binding transcriptional ArsR family regulator